MSILYSDVSKEFHLFNDKISYIISVLPNGELGNLYFGKRIRHKESFSYLLEGGLRSLAVYTKEHDYFFSPGYSRMEYPSYGHGDFREHAYEISQENGSSITEFSYQSHQIYSGKEPLQGLPAVYVENAAEADSLQIVLTDEMLQTDCILKYSIFRDYPVITRSVEFVNRGRQSIQLERVFSASLDLPDTEYEMVQLSGAWSRERQVITRKIGPGIQGINSRKGISSAEHNPFIALKRCDTGEHTGEVIGMSLVYSGNHIGQVEVDTCNMTRIQMGIHPDGFAWKLEEGESFQSPEAVLVYSADGLNGMSQVYHKLYRTRLVRGYWRDRERPILINNWEATGADFTEEKLLAIAKEGKELGLELMVMDDGWFGNRENDHSGLGDWYVKNHKKLPNGIAGLAEKINDLGLKFGIWIEPEMVSKDSDLYREHPEWILCPPGRRPSPSRNQYVLDFSRSDVRDYIYEMLEKVFSESKISYVKWDMNRYLTECYSGAQQAQCQGKVLHQYILGVYDFYERLRIRFPEILFESCASGGARFDPGMLYYAPQAWTSDDTDAMERLQIQYGTSYVYPLSSMGAHVSEVPNQQVGRVTPLETRINAALFGVFGFELDLAALSIQDKKKIKEGVLFAKKYRKLIMSGTFYRLQSPADSNACAWMAVSEDRTEALVGYYRLRGVPNGPWIRLRLHGLNENLNYVCSGKESLLFGGDELMNAGMVIDENELCNGGGDYSSAIYLLTACL